jgi:hypothetical protein
MDTKLLIRAETNKLLFLNIFPEAFTVILTISIVYVYLKQELVYFILLISTIIFSLAIYSIVLISTHKTSKTISASAKKRFHQITHSIGDIIIERKLQYMLSFIVVTISLLISFWIKDYLLQIYRLLTNLPKIF